MNAAASATVWACSCRTDNEVDSRILEQLILYNRHASTINMHMLIVVLLTIINVSARQMIMLLIVAWPLVQMIMY